MKPVLDERDSSHTVDGTACLAGEGSQLCPHKPTYASSDPFFDTLVCST